MERQIGEEFEIKIRVRTVETINGLTCSICALRGFCHSEEDNYKTKISTCFPAIRTDEKNVYYEPVSYEEN